MHHVPEKVRFLLESRSFDRNMREGLLGKDIVCVIDTLRTDTSSDVTSSTNVIERFLKRNIQRPERTTGVLAQITHILRLIAVTFLHRRLEHVRERVVLQVVTN
jgi:hypothetical protein